MPLVIRANLITVQSNAWTHISTQEAAHLHLFLLLFSWLVLHRLDNVVFYSSSLTQSTEKKKKKRSAFAGRHEVWRSIARWVTRSSSFNGVVEWCQGCCGGTLAGTAARAGLTEAWTIQGYRSISAWLWHLIWAATRKSGSAGGN